MIRKFNEAYIKEFDESYYIKCLRTINYLDSIRNNYNCRYDSSYDKFDGMKNLFKESLDHYVLKLMESDSNFINTLECENYFKYLNKLVNQNEFDYYTNVVMFNVLNNPKFSKYKNKFTWIRKDIFDRVSIKIDGIIDKIKKNQIISQNELNLICGFVSDYRENNDLLREVIKYVFYYLARRDSLFKCSPEIVSAIMTYIPYTCGEIKKDGFNPADVRIFVANQYSWQGQKYLYDGLGQSFYLNKSIIMPGSVVSKTNFKSIASSSKPFGFKEYTERGNYDFPLLVMTAFHEITHQYQNYIAKIEGRYNSFVVNGYPMVVSKILEEELHDYKRNHDNDDIEIQATEYSWEMCRRFYEDIIREPNLRKELVIRSNRNRNGTKVRSSFARKQDNAGNVVETFRYNNFHMLRIMGNKKKRDKYFLKYPNLRIVFNEEGKLRTDVIFIPNFGYTQLGCCLIVDLINTEKADDIIRSKINMQGNKNEAIKNAASNIMNGIGFYEKQLMYLEYYTKKDFDDYIKINESLEKVAKDLLDKHFKTLENGKRIMHQILKCHDYDSSIERSSRIVNRYYKNICLNINSGEYLGKKGRSR